MRISASLLAQIVEHAQREDPNECCGLVAIEKEAVISVHPLTNTAHSPFRFEVDGQALLQELDKLDASGAQLGAIYHSHTRSEPYPSQTDINFAAFWPGVEWLIVGLQVADDPVVRSYRIDDGAVQETTVEVV